MKVLPITAEELVKELNTLYPEEHPKLDYPDRVIWFKAGQRDVVNTLLKRLEYTEKKY